MATSLTHTDEGDEWTPIDVEHSPLGVQYPHVDIEYPMLIETMGVIIPCSGIYVPRYASKCVSSFEHLVHTNDSPLYVPTKIGLPLWLRHHATLLSDPDNEQENIRARYLATSISTASPLINANDQDGAALCAQMLKGSKLVMRKDEFNLIPQHLEVLCAFCKRLIEFTYDYSGKEGDNRDKIIQQKEWFQRMATRAHFESFYGHYCAQRTANDPKWRNLPSPYDTARLGKDFTNVPHGGIWKAQHNASAALSTNNVTIEGQDMGTTGPITPGEGSNREAGGRQDRSHSDSTISMDDEVIDTVQPPGSTDTPRPQSTVLPPGKKKAAKTGGQKKAG